MQDDMNPDDAGQTEAPGSDLAAESPQEPEKPQSRKAVWLAMGAVALALGLIWVAPGIEPHVDESAPGSTSADYPGEPEDAEAAGKPAKAAAPAAKASASRPAAAKPSASAKRNAKPARAVREAPGPRPSGKADKSAHGAKAAKKKKK